MPNLRKSLRRNFWHSRAQKPPSSSSLPCVAATQTIDNNKPSSTCSFAPVKSPSFERLRNDVAIPALLVNCSQEIQSRGLSTEGIFRRSGNSALIEKLLKEFAAADDPFHIDLSTVPVHTLTGLFKRYLQQLSEPVIPKLLQPELLNAYESTPDVREKVRRINAACQSLPDFHGILLCFIIRFAHSVSNHADHNKMTPENLSIILAPTCVRLDGVSHLLSNSSDGNIYKAKASPLQKPVKMFRTLSLRRASKPAAIPQSSLSQTTLSCDILSKSSLKDRLQPLFTSMHNTSKSHKLQEHQQQRHMPKYAPHNLLQLELIKDNTRWNKFFQFMIENAPKFSYDSNVNDNNNNNASIQENIVDDGNSLKSESTSSLSSPKVKRIKDIFGSMLAMFPDIARELKITMSPTRTTSPSRALAPSIDLPAPGQLINGPEPNVSSVSSPSSSSSSSSSSLSPPMSPPLLSSSAATVVSRSARHRFDMGLPPPAAAMPPTRSSLDMWSSPLAPLRRTLTADTPSNIDDESDSPCRFSGTKYEAIWQHWKEREEEERRKIPALSLRNPNIQRKGDMLKSLSQNVAFAAPPTNKRPLSVAFIPSARPNYFLR
ncbi:hypothetical protein BDB00DRAFT_173090 [Zychaea mexicana]|uniref:uncharacterized protein n=1 Tax=Zychaea mexicana TaxID=64656 RepID=UPI0022FF11C8|nr:uncharacterized protein BDB00DRAFT_173090 [Zychaea mexicana]KAI9479625.1 hypothetical protein BDB00DRAFT_173090 [Zychaea mexicana]